MYINLWQVKHKLIFAWHALLMSNFWAFPGILYALPESERKLQSSIRDLCVMWWEKGLPAKEDMGKTAFIMLLRKSLETKTVRFLLKHILYVKSDIFVPFRGCVFPCVA